MAVDRRGRPEEDGVQPGARELAMFRGVCIGYVCREDVAEAARDGVLRAGVLVAEVPAGLGRERYAAALGCAVRDLGVLIADCAAVR